MDAVGTGPVCLANLRGALCPALDIFRLIWFILTQAVDA